MSGVHKHYGLSRKLQYASSELVIYDRYDKAMSDNKTVIPTNLLVEAVFLVPVMIHGQQSPLARPTFREYSSKKLLLALQNVP